MIEGLYGLFTQLNSSSASYKRSIASTDVPVFVQIQNKYTSKWYHNKNWTIGYTGYIMDLCTTTINSNTYGITYSLIYFRKKINFNPLDHLN